MSKFNDSWRGGGTGLGPYILQTNAAGSIALVAKGTSGQTANIFEVQNSAGTTLMSVNNSGNLSITGSISAVINETVTGDLTLTGNLVVNGNSTLGNAASDTLSVAATATFSERIVATEGINASGTSYFGGTAIFNNATKFANGTAADPSITFQDDQTTGIYRSAASIVSFTTAGARQMDITSTGLVLPTGNSIKIHNIADETTDTQPLNIGWVANVATIQVLPTGAGTTRTLQLVGSNFAGGHSTLKLTVSALPYFNHTTTSGTAGTMNSFTSTSTASSGTATMLGIVSVINQTGTAATNMLLINPTLTGVGSGTQNLLLLQAGSVDKFAFNTKGEYTQTQTAATTDAPVAFTLTTGAHTGLTASTENNSMLLNFSATKQFATGAITMQREMRIQQPTYGFVGASTVTLAATVGIDAGPTEGTNAAITSSAGLLVGGIATVKVTSGNYSNIFVAPNPLATGVTNLNAWYGYNYGSGMSVSLGDTGSMDELAAFKNGAVTFTGTGTGGNRTVTLAAGAIFNAPVASTNMTFTQVHGLVVATGTSRFDGEVIIGTSGATASEVLDLTYANTTYVNDVGLINLARTGALTGVAGETIADMLITPAFTLTEPGSGSIEFIGLGIDMSGIAVTAGAGTSTVRGLYISTPADGDVGTSYAIDVERGAVKFSGGNYGVQTTALGGSLEMTASEIFARNPSGTIAIGTPYSFGITTYNNGTASLTMTDAASVYIAGAPVASTNVIFTNTAMALWVDSGISRFDGAIGIGASPATAPSATLLYLSGGGDSNMLEMTNTDVNGKTWQVQSGSDGDFHINSYGATADVIKLVHVNSIATLSIDAGVSTFAGKIVSTAGSIQVKKSVANVSTPPTDAELDSAFGDPTVVGSGFVGVLDDADGGTAVYWVYTTGTAGEWFYVLGTKAA